nr:MAG TPA: hypothetical protein [Caudoviricetes sp.]
MVPNRAEVHPVAAQALAPRTVAVVSLGKVQIKPQQIIGTIQVPVVVDGTVVALHILTVAPAILILPVVAVGLSTRPPMRLTDLLDILG